MDNEKTSWCACGHTLDNTYTFACLPSLTYKFRVTAVNRLGDSEPLVSENISLSEGVDSSVRSELRIRFQGTASTTRLLVIIFLLIFC